MKQLRLLIYFSVSLGLFSCVHLVSYYDALSYKNLTDLKAETKVFFDACRSQTAKGERALATIDGLVLSSAKAYEYEKGKALNDDTVAQLAIIEETIVDIKNRYAMNEFAGNSCAGRGENQQADLATGCLSTGYCYAKWRVLETAFDIAISTEQSKLKESE